MKHTLRCHGFGGMDGIANYGRRAERMGAKTMSQNRASPQGVTAGIIAGFVARLAKIDILATPRFAPSPIPARNARAFHRARGSLGLRRAGNRLEG